MPPPPNKSDSNPNNRNFGKNASEDAAEKEEISMNNLWVGNLSPDTTDADLNEVFGKFGTLDSVCSYASRNFAFIYFKRPEDAKKAKDTLQGTTIRGNPIKIEFARPAKPGKQLWVGGISSSVTKEQLETEFLKFGKIEEFKFLRDRNSALVGYIRLEDAAAALKNLNGKHIGGEAIRVDFLRSHPSKRDSWSDFHDSRDGSYSNRRSGGHSDPLWMPPEQNFPDSSGFGHKRYQQSQAFGGGRKEGPPSNVLWIGYPPSVQIDEHMLHNAMILFGEIERIKCFPARHYSFVEFRSIDEARRAKEGLQGRLFNDPRIQILFSSSEGGHGDRDNPPFFPGMRGPRSDMLYNDPPFGGPMEMFGHPRPPIPNNFSGPLGPNAIPGANMLMRPFPPQIDPLLANPEVLHLAGLLQNLPEANLNSPMGTNWRRGSPPSALGMRSQVGPPGAWDRDSSPFQREAKRSRIGSPLPIDDGSFRAREASEHHPGGFGPQSERGLLGPPVNVHSQGQSGLLPGRASSVDHLGRKDHHSSVDDDCCWRGVIAKGGTPVCSARCVPVGKGIDATLPETVNCSARTGLDMLTKHYSEASGFDIVFFLPDSEEDFSSYTEFLRYLSGKSRAGVAKFDDGTTLFLVPPSEFLTQVLKVSGPERLYGVVLKFPQQSSNLHVQQPQHLSHISGSSLPPPPPPLLPPPTHYVDKHRIPSVQADHVRMPGKEDVSQMNYTRGLNEESIGVPGAANPSPGDPRIAHSGAVDYGSNPTSSQVSLTPELIATLTALLPGTVQSSASGAAQLPLSSASKLPSFSPSMASEKSVLSHGWQHEQSILGGAVLQSREEQASHPSQQLGLPYNNHSSLLSQYGNLGNVGNGPEHSQIINSAQVVNPNFMHSQTSISSGSGAGFVTPPQGGQYVVPPGQQYQFEASNAVQNYGLVGAQDGSGVYQSSVLPQATSVSASIQSQIGSMAQSQAQSGAGKLSTELSSQIQQLQSMSAGTSQATSESEADKNLRYQSTLQFAANLLFQIQQQQQQQQPNAPVFQGSGEQQ
ncbi:Flowering time control protein [Nymphaea thermarum]|nr:Flowering time control protein [Nymphaea thermarum]